MIPTDRPPAYRVLLVDDDDAVRAVMTETLGRKGFDVVAAASVTEALRLITIESFDVLITDLHMPHAGDGFTVVTAMRHSQPICAYADREWLPGRAERDGHYPSGSRRNSHKTIR